MQTPNNDDHYDDHELLNQRTENYIVDTPVEPFLSGELSSSTNKLTYDDQGKVGALEQHKLKKLLSLPIIFGILATVLFLLSLAFLLYTGIAKKNWINIFAFTGIPISIPIYIISIIVAAYLIKKIRLVKEDNQSRVIHGFLRMTEDITATDINRPDIDIHSEIEKAERCLREADSYPMEVLQQNDLDLHIIHLQLWSRLAILYDRIDDRENAEKYTELCESV